MSLEHAVELEPVEENNEDMDAFIVPPNGGERIENPLGGEIVFKARGAQTREALTVFEAANAPSQGPPLHVHALLDELIYVIDGTIRIRLNDRVERAAAGACVFIPRGTPHTWAVASDGAARLLVVVAPAGLEQFFDSTASAGGGQAEDAFSRFGGDDLTVVDAPLAVTHPSSQSARGSVAWRQRAGTSRERAVV
jgi:quercetin dioxygenase-like cupin family protein